MMNDKINGFGKYEVEEAARSMIRSEEIKQGDPKFYGTVMTEVKKTADAAMAAAKKKDSAAKELVLHKKVSKKMKRCLARSHITRITRITRITLIILRNLRVDTNGDTQICM